MIVVTRICKTDTNFLRSSADAGRTNDICVNTPQFAEDQTASMMSSSSLNQFLTAQYITKFQNIDAKHAARKERRSGNDFLFC